MPNQLNFKHDKFALSNFNVLRGLHGDNKTWKLVSCVFGEIYQVVVVGCYSSYEIWIIKIDYSLLEKAEYIT